MVIACLHPWVEPSHHRHRFKPQNIPVVRAERAFSAKLADSADARWLDMEIGGPVLVVAGYNTDAAGHELMRLRHHTRADRAEYVISVGGRPENRSSRK
jgi:DNA-binding GntR family transcriptional regulator